MKQFNFASLAGVRVGVFFCLAFVGVSLTACVEIYVVDHRPPGELIEVVVVTPTSPLDTPTPAPEQPPTQVELSAPADQASGPSPTAHAPLAPGTGDIWLRPADGAEMVRIPAGEFLRGASAADDGAGEDETPQHAVTLADFWIDRREVANGQYRRCVEAGVCDPPTECDLGTPTYGDADRADHPVVCVSWADASTYCRWSGARLPTEAEWEKAARGTDGRRYPWGDAEMPGVLNLCDRNCGLDSKITTVDDGYSRTAPVGQYPAGQSPYGVLDMAGNVWEWVADWYDPGAYGIEVSANPLGPVSGDKRVSRGGSWDSDWYGVRATCRNWDTPTFRAETVGFRCSLFAVPASP